MTACRSCQPPLRGCTEEASLQDAVAELLDVVWYGSDAGGVEQDAITSPGTDGRPRPEGNKSANSSAGNNRCRCSASSPYTDPSGTRCPHNAAASNN